MGKQPQRPFHVRIPLIQPRQALWAYQRHHLGGETLQALDAFGDGGAAEIEDQLVYAYRRKASDVTGDIVWFAGEATAGAVAIRDAGIIQRRLV
jgi:hypothetical protein